MHVKKVTQKDRYGNTMSYEFEVPEKGIDTTRLMEKQMDQMAEMVPPMMDHPGEPMGSDTVPAWLTPGEFVVNAEAMRMPGVEEQVTQINEMGKGVQAMQGGSIPTPQGYADGGKVVPEWIQNLDPAVIARLLGQVGQAYQYAAPAVGFDNGGAVTAPPVAPWTQRPEGTEELLHEREGYVPEVYLDSLGKPTVGYGHLIEDKVWDKNDPRIGTQPYSEAELKAFFDKDVQAAQSGAVRNIGRETWSNLNPEQQKVLTSMAFQLGETGQKKFGNMIKAIQAGDYASAAREALTGSKPGTKSKWLKQTPKRAFDLANAFDPAVAAEYKSAGGAVYLDDGGWSGFLNKYVLGPKTQLPSGDVEEIPPVMEESAVPADAFPPGIVDQPNTGHPYANAVPAGIDPVPEDMSIPGSSISPAAAGEVAASNAPGSSLTAPIHEGIPGTSGAAAAPVNYEEPVPEEGWWDGISDWAFDGSVAEERNADFNKKAAEANREDVDATLQNILDRKAKGLSVNEKTLKGTEAAADHQDNQLIEAIDAQAENGQLSSDEAEAAKAQINSDMVAREAAKTQANYEAEAFGAAGRGEAVNKDSSEAVKAGVVEEFLAGSDSSEAGPGSDQGGENTDAGTVEDAGKKAPPAQVKEAESVIKSLFGDLFDSKELGRMAIMYAGSRLLGYPHGGSLQFAAKQYVGRVDAKVAGKQSEQQELLKSGKYTPQSIANYMKSGDITDLTPPGASYQGTGVTKKFTHNGKAVTLQQVKGSDGGTYWQDPVTQRVIKNPALLGEYDPKNVRGTPEYNSRISSESKDNVAIIKGLQDQFDAIPADDKFGKTTYTTEINPELQGKKIAQWAFDNNIDAAQIGTLMEQAYHDAINDAKSSGKKPRDLTPYLNNLIIRQQTGVPELFATSEDGKNMVDGQKMSSLNQSILHISGLQGNVGDKRNIDRLNNFYTFAASKWSDLDPEAQKQYKRKATDSETGFYVYVKDQLASYYNQNQ